MKSIYFLFALIAILFVSCQPSQQQEEVEATEEYAINSYVSKISEAHGKEALSKHYAVSFHIDLEFGGQKALDATILTRTNSEAVIL